MFKKIKKKLGFSVIKIDKNDPAYIMIKTKQEEAIVKQKETDTIEGERVILSAKDNKRLDLVGYILAKKFSLDKLVFASEIETARIEGREVHGYMQRMFPDYDWLWNNDVLSRACYLAMQDYQPIIHNLATGFDFPNMYRSLVKLPEMDFFKEFPNFEFNRLIILSDEPLKKDMIWLHNYPWQTPEGYDTTMTFAPCQFLNMGSPLHDLPILVLTWALGKGNLFFKAKTTAEKLTEEKDEIIRREIFKQREKEKHTDELIDELEIESEGWRKRYQRLKYKMLNRAPYAGEEEFEEFERKEMRKRQPFNKINYKRIILGIIIVILIVGIIIGVGLLFVPKPVQTVIPDAESLSILNIFHR